MELRVGGRGGLRGVSGERVTLSPDSQPGLLLGNQEQSPRDTSPLGHPNLWLHKLLPSQSQPCCSPEENVHNKPCVL